MDFSKIIYERQSCRKYDPTRDVEKDKLARVLEAGRMSPSACNGQPYLFTVCRGESARAIAGCVSGMGMNKFAKDVPVFLVLSERPYVATAALGAKAKGNDYRSLDIGIAAAHLVCAATEEGLSTCILGWFDDAAVRRICSLDAPVRLVIALGYADPTDSLREKKRKSEDDLIVYKN